MGAVTLLTFGHQTDLITIKCLANNNKLSLKIYYIVVDRFSQIVHRSLIYYLKYFTNLNIRPLQIMFLFLKTESIRGY